MERDELADWLRLALTPGIGDGTARRLLAAFGLPGAVFTQSPAALRDVVTPAQASALQAAPAGLDAQLARTWDWLHTPEPEGAVRRLVTLGDPGYPAALLETADPPLMLYLLGAPAFDLTQLARSVAIVGSRNPTPQGELNARAFARALGDAGVVVVSGLALGVDGAAHQGALDAAEAARGGPRLATVAVVGTGLDRVYPARHRTLAHRIASNGLIVSEFALGTPPLHPNFPKRNRIIAGLSRGTLVIEAALQSGSLITARLAVEQGREVFAIPGSIHSPQSRGCHALIRQGAKLVESVQDVLEELRFDDTAPATSRANAEEGPDRADIALLQAIGFDPVGLDALCARTGHGAAALQGLLLELELGGRVARLPGGLFQRVAQG
ncbi:DNA-processing protein DprA [Variovorax boronicumulans]|uniref:DNA-processing protein DprA n=1 Tax=Variovorax boronicumulans TaxID=436515 RepID=UPI001C55DDAE